MCSKQLSLGNAGREHSKCILLEDYSGGVSWAVIRLSGLAGLTIENCACRCISWFAPKTKPTHADYIVVFLYLVESEQNSQKIEEGSIQIAIPVKCLSNFISFNSHLFQIGGPAFLPRNKKEVFWWKNVHVEYVGSFLKKIQNVFYPVLRFLLELFFHSL